MINFIQGNCLEKLKEIPVNSIDCVISSPPYFGLRDYGTEPQIIGGNKDCKHEWNTFIKHGNSWGIPNKNIDGAFQTKKTNHSFVKNQEQKRCTKCNAWVGQMGLEPTYKEYINNTLKVFETFRPKLKEYATIWWNVGDSYHNFRPTNNKQRLYKHPAYPQQSISGNRQDLPTESLKRNQRYDDIKEKDLMMIPNRVAIALQENGWYIRSEIIWHKPNPMPESIKDRPTSCHEKIWLKTKNKKYYYDYESIKEPAKDWGKRDRKIGSAFVDGTPGRSKQSGGKDCNFATKGRNKRNVWTITTKPCREAHFATFPMDLIEPCVLAGCKEGGTILDPFGGAGTTGLVAHKHNRNAILIELNPKYIDIAKKRFEKIFGSLL